MTSAMCWLNGELTPAHAARVPVLDHGLLYGDGVVEGIRFYRGRAFRLDAHLARLQRSARAIRLNLPLDASALATAIGDTIAAFGAPDGYLRLVVTRGAGRLGIDPSSCAQPNVFIIADELTMASERMRREGARVIVAATRRLGPDGLDPRVKSLNYLNHILARLEAVNAGADEAILLNGAGHVAEGTADNVFIVRDGVLLTPPTCDGALEGITREVVLELARDLDIAARERSLGPYDLYTADECFLTGTGAELIPVREVDGRALRPGPVYRQLATAYLSLIERETVTLLSDDIRNATG
jgi:branched-chain amino acid aminotransferase